MSLPAAAEQALAAFSAASGWEARARLLMQWGERLEPLTPAQCSSEHLVQGCESQVWLLAEQHQQHWQFRAASEARLLRGLLAVLLARVNGLSGAELANVNLLDWFTQLGLTRQLSPSRSNGLQAVLRRMQELTATSS
ncbi:MAG: SufE family protein [Pseudomonas sp.]|uniref:SufE family protein n=1 Tax=Pseudomonas sp. TaxID=306 RepID=UPI0027337F68|nr:SufE family protein [Pseudomonas sp.]MDP3846603.1 SufE family protein [Pseudomonas sp.]